MQRLTRVAILTSVMGVALLTATSAGAASTGATSSTPSVSSINWGPCAEQDLQDAGAQCGMLSVPLNYSKPNGPQIQLAVSRIQHTSSNYQGIILTNPGGPGGSGLDLNTFLIPTLQDEGFNGAVDDYDWIGFDPRGVGSSVPAISCVPNYFGPDRPNYVPNTPQLLNYWLSASNFYAQSCANQSKQQTQLLNNMTTRDSALDMDSIRKALGQQQITYYGFSYGTYLGQVYATLFPSHVRRMILDSNVDPRKVWYQANLDQDLAFNRNINIWFGWLAKYDDVYHLGATERAVRQTFYATEKALTANPAGGVVGPDEWADTFLYPAYYQVTWLEWAQVFSDWVNDHDAAAAQELIDHYQEVDTPGDDNGYAVYDAVQCTDVQWPTKWSRWSADNWAIYHRAPFATWLNAWFNAPCIYWPAPASTPVKINGKGISSALLIDETLDAATPFEGSLEVRKLFPNSVLLAEPGGTSHADSLFGNLCVDGTIANYLETGALPARNNNARWDKTCAPLPQPVPDTASAAPQVAPLLKATKPDRRLLGVPAVELR
jgi:pimeloyl-ACP methyl ester carboxylesterase